MMAVKLVDGEQLLIQLHGGVVSVWKLDSSRQLVQSIESNRALYALWSASSPDILIIYETLVEVYCKSACPGDNSWKLLLRNSLVPKSDCNAHHFLAFNQPLLVMKEGEKSVKLLNIETGTMIEFWNKKFLSLSVYGMFLVLASAELESSSNIEVYSIRDAHFNAAFAGAGESLCRHVTLDVPNSVIQNLSWRHNDGKTSTNALYILLTNGMLRLYEIFNEQVIDEGAIIALAMSAAMAARSINSDIGGDGTMTPVQEPKVKTVMKPKSVSLCEVDLNERGIFNDHLRLVDLQLTFSPLATRPESLLHSHRHGSHHQYNHQQGKVRDSMFDAGIWIAFEHDGEDDHQHQQGLYRLRLVCLRQDTIHGTYRVDESSNTSICLSKLDQLSNQGYTGKTHVHATIIKDFVESVHIISQLSTQVISDVIIKRSDAMQVVDRQQVFWWIGSSDLGLLARNAVSSSTTTAQMYIVQVQDADSLTIVTKEENKVAMLLGFISQDEVVSSNGHWVYHQQADSNNAILLCHNDTFAIIYQMQANQDNKLTTRDKAGTILDIHTHTSPSDGFSIEIVPDEQYGLGLRLDEIIDADSGLIKVVISSFKPHPITKEPMAAQVSGKIQPGDEIIGAEHLRFTNQSQASVIQSIKGILTTPAHHNKPLSLLLRRPVHANNTLTQDTERRNATIRISMEHCTGMLSLTQIIKLGKNGRNIVSAAPFSIGSDVYVLTLSQSTASSATVLDIDKLIFITDKFIAETHFTQNLQFTVAGSEHVVCTVSKPSPQNNGGIHLTVVITTPQLTKHLTLVLSSHSISDTRSVIGCEISHSWSYLKDSLSVKNTLISQALQTFASIRSHYLSDHHAHHTHHTAATENDSGNSGDKSVFECLMQHLVVTSNDNIISTLMHTLSIPSSITHHNEHVKQPTSILTYNEINNKPCLLGELISRPLRFLEDKETMLLRSSASDFLLNKLRRKEYVEMISALNGVYHDELCPMLFGEREVTRLFFFYAKIVLLMYEKLSSSLVLSVNSNDGSLNDMTDVILQAAQLEPHALTTLKLSLLHTSWRSLFLTSAKYLEDIHNEVFRRGRKLRSLTTSLTEEDDEDDSRPLDFSIDGGGSTNSIIGGSIAKLEYIGLTSMQVVNNVFSPQQDQLFAMFIDPFNTLGLDDTGTNMDALRKLGKESLFMSLQQGDNNDGKMDRELFTHINILDYFTQIKASFWLHNLEPVMNIILRHALRQFKVNKVSMSIFLELVVIGKVDLLIQLVKTDFSSSGKQLLTLLLLVDEAFNPANLDENKVNNCVTKLRKNAFALIRKQRYRDAIAVLLLIPTQAMIKSAVSLLTKQYNDPYLAHLILRCLESRLYVHHKDSTNMQETTGSISQPKLEKLIIQESIRSNAEMINRVGFVHGSYNHLLLTDDIIPMLLNEINQSENCNNLTRMQSLLQASIAALWTQNIDLMKKIFDLLLLHLEDFDFMSNGEASVIPEMKKMIQHALHHDFSGDDVDLVFRFMTYTYGNFSDTTTVMQLLLPALTYMEEYSMFMDFSRIGKVHLVTLKILQKLGLTREVLRKQQAFSLLTPAVIQQRVKSNAFFAHALKCRDTYKENWNGMQKEQQAVIAASMAAAAASAAASTSAAVEGQEQPKASLFNFAASSNKPGAAKKKAAPRNLLDDDFAPPPQRTANKSAMDMFDPPAAVQQSSVSVAAPRSALDDFDSMPVRRPAKKAQAAALSSEAVDIFDMTPTTRNKR